ncbi:MAG: 23S rRNA (guanosine(2251)-2'-O)-methyltransferase RlmB [Legionellales bacterium]|jgi:23S rRNA (guanosine2251-2'-O)-methyltransferase
MNEEYIFGYHAVLALLEHNADRVIKLYLQRGRDDARVHKALRLAKDGDIATEVVSREKLDFLVSGAKHQGLVAESKQDVLHKMQYGNEDLEGFLNSLEHEPLLLILDGVEDPHNLGACLRTANAAGVDAVIVPKDNAVGMTSVVKKVACGAAEEVNFFQVTNLARTLDLLKQRNIWVCGADADAEQSIYAAKLTGGMALVLGAEGSGLRCLTKEKCDFLVKIPMYGSVASLNVSVAAGVCLFEMVRQRMTK